MPATGSRPRTDPAAGRSSSSHLVTPSIGSPTSCPAGQSRTPHVDIEVYGCQGDGGCDRNVDTSRSTNGQGNFSLDTTNQYNIRGNDYVNARWESPQGDEVFRSLGAPSMTAWVGNNEVWGQAKPRNDVTAWLFNSQGTQKAKFRHRADAWDGDWYGLFEGNNRAVNIRVGDFVGSNVASDALFQIIATNATFNPGADTVSGKCFKNKVVYLSAHHADFSDFGEADGMTNNNGNFSINLFNQDGYDLQSGDTVDIECRNASGDSQLTTFEVP